MAPSHSLAKKSTQKRSMGIVIQDQIKFLKSWASSPLRTGAIAPSGRALASALAAAVDLNLDGPIIELGPGTGVVTAALLARGVDPKRIYSIEYSPEFYELLKNRFPEVNIIHGDAYALEDTLKGLVNAPAAAIISSLPLFTQSEEKRAELLKAAFRMMHPNAALVQFSYATVPAFPADKVSYVASASKWIFNNLPPARVWSYRQVEGE